jgi:hypothetical protein
MNKEDWSLLSFRERFGYRLIRILSSLQQLVYLFVLRTYVWRSADGTLTPVHKMTDSHLVNSLRMLRRNGGQAKIVLILRTELERRHGYSPKGF